ncbi:MAG TPA: hypothetical protein VK890_01045 [Bacteroidia bacterium]|jgi:hypothetical protein|nr:hypothetical protein [Bacteroidia bacterium]
MKSSIKTTTVLFLLAIGLFTACKKNEPILPATTNTSTNTDHYSSLQDFFAKNGVAMQTFTISGTAGGSFTTPQGTKVIVPANCFIDKLGNAVTGNVTIQFKDIYTKSDMLLSNMTTMYYQTPLKSGGEFFIKAIANGGAVNLNGLSNIKVLQPLNGWALDNSMIAFDAQARDTMGTMNWAIDSATSNIVKDTLARYMLSVHAFDYPVDSGTWCNTDRSFSGYTQTSFTAQTTDDSINSGRLSSCCVFFLFKGVNSIIYCEYSQYSGTTTIFPYNYAPLGYQCTIVAVEVRKNGQLRCAFVPTTITTNGTVNFNCTPTTTADFITELNTYNH